MLISLSCAARRKSLSRIGALLVTGFSASCGLYVCSARAAPAAHPAGAPAPSGWKPASLTFAGYFGNPAKPMRIAQAEYVLKLDAGAYQLALKVNSALANLLYESEGTIGPAGLRPSLYRETRRLPLRAPSVREVRFAEAPAAERLVVPPGTQDRLSIIAQLSWLARTQPKRVAAGSELKLPLASWDSVDEVVVAVGAVQSQPIEDGATVKARRFHRQNSEGGGSTLDFWLADDEQKSPVVISFADGDKSLRFVRMPG